MPSAKTKKSVKVIKPLRVKEESSSQANVVKNSFPLISKLAIVGIFGILCYLLAFKYRSFIVVGTVNNYPISRMQLNSKLTERYGKEVLDEIVNQKLLDEQIKKNNIVVSESDLNAEMDKMVKQYGSEQAFKDALVKFKLTPEQARESIRQSMGFKKLVESNNKIEITDQAVKDYFDKNKTSFEGKKFEEVSAQIKDSLYQQELYTKSQELFSNIRKEAKINSFI
jgi:foldase protein PrsA